MLLVSKLVFGTDHLVIENISSLLVISSTSPCYIVLQVHVLFSFYTWDRQNCFTSPSFWHSGSEQWHSHFGWYSPDSSLRITTHLSKRPGHSESLQIAGKHEMKKQSHFDVVLHVLLLCKQKVILLSFPDNIVQSRKIPMVKDMLAGMTLIWLNKLHKA